MENINLLSKKKWVKVKLGDIANTITKGSTPTTYGFIYLDKGIPFIKIENIENDKISHRSIKQFISNEAHEYQSRSQLQEGDILFSIAGTIGKTCVVTKNDIPSNTNQALSIIRGTNKCLLPKFLKLQFLSILSTAVKKKARGGAMSNISLNDLKKMDILLPSIREQNRIVEKIEELFSDLDKATEDLKKTQEQLKIYRQAVLKAAFEGTLIKNFKYTEISLSKFEHKGGGTPSTKKREYWNGNINWITSANIDKKNRIHFDKKISQLGVINSSTNIIPKNSVIIVTRVGLGKVAVNDEDTAINQDCQGIICNSIEPYYLMWYLKSIANEFIFKGQGTTINGITISKLVDTIIKVPEKEIQKQIVNEIESRLSVCDKLEDTIQQSLKKIEYLRQSILKKAFEGKLVSQDPNDLPACELLKQIKIEKDKMSKNGK